MLSATHFVYDNKFSGEFGLLIAQLDADSMEESTPFTYTIHSSKTPRQKRFNFAGIENEEMPSLQFTIFLSDGSPMTDVIQRQILSWLVGRNGFKELQFLQPDLEGYTYNCIFAEAGKQHHLNSVVGIILTATFDSIYCCGNPTIKTITDDGTGKDIIIANNSDLIDDYVYPVVRFHPNQPLDDDGTDIVIINNSDIGSAARKFKFVGIADGELDPSQDIFVDNELKMINVKNKGEEEIVEGAGEFLSNFNKNWLRLKKGGNRLTIKINGTVTIEVPHYALIGF